MIIQIGFSKTHLRNWVSNLEKTKFGITYILKETTPISDDNHKDIHVYLFRRAMSFK